MRSGDPLRDERELCGGARRRARRNRLERRGGAQQGCARLGELLTAAAVSPCRRRAAVVRERARAGRTDGRLDIRRGVIGPVVGVRVDGGREAGRRRQSEQAGDDAPPSGLFAS